MHFDARGLADLKYITPERGREIEAADRQEQEDAIRCHCLLLECLW